MAMNIMITAPITRKIILAKDQKIEWQNLPSSEVWTPNKNSLNKKYH